MQKLDLNTVPKDIKPNPIFEGLPESLKNPKCFKTVESKLFKALLSDHKHQKVSSFATCARCKKRREKRSLLMKELGFKDFTQYMEWKKVMQIMHNKSNFQLR